MRSQAIRNAHPEVVSVNAGTTAWDKDGNEITLDEEIRVKALKPLNRMLEIV